MTTLDFSLNIQSVVASATEMLAEAEQTWYADYEAHQEKMAKEADRKSRISIMTDHFTRIMHVSLTRAKAYQKAAEAFRKQEAMLSEMYDMHRLSVERGKIHEAIKMSLDKDTWPLIEKAVDAFLGEHAEFSKTHDWDNDAREKIVRGMVKALQSAKAYDSGWKGMVYEGTKIVPTITIDGGVFYGTTQIKDGSAFDFHVYGLLVILKTLGTHKVVLTKTWKPQEDPEPEPAAPEIVEEEQDETPQPEQEEQVEPSVDENHEDYLMLVENMSYREIQAEAKKLGLKANGKKSELALRVAQALNS